jgi:hypothetical protein
MIKKFKRKPIKPKHITVLSESNDLYNRYEDERYFHFLEKYYTKTLLGKIEFFIRKIFKKSLY